MCNWVVAEVGYIPTDSKHKSQALLTVAPTFIQARHAVCVSPKRYPKRSGVEFRARRPFLLRLHISDP